MTEVDESSFREAANLCVSLAESEQGVHLDGSMESLTLLDEVCESLTQDGPLEGERLSLWGNLVGSYTGDVIARAYDGRWVIAGVDGGSYGIRALGVTAFPFNTAYRALMGEDGKSLASLARALPVIASRSAADE